MIEMHMQEMLKELQKMPEKLQKKVVNGAVRASAKPIIKEARNRTPVNTGNLKKSIGVNKKRQKGTIVEYDVSPRKGGKYDGFYGHLVEFGHVVTNKYKKKHLEKKILGHAAPHPFLRPAFEAKNEESIEAFKKYMRERMDKELSK